MEKTKYDIFISHSSIDADTALLLCEAFENQGFQCWIAPRNVTVGLPFAGSIVKGIHNSKAIVVLFSTNANKSNGVLKELEIANRRAMPIIPLRIEDVFPTEAIEYYLVSNHWMDAINPTSINDFDKFIIEVQNTIDPETVETPVYGILSNNTTTKTEKPKTFRESLSALFMPFLISFILLNLLSNMVYPSLEAKDVVYSFLVLSFLFAKGFLFFRGKVKG